MNGFSEHIAKFLATRATDFRRVLTRLAARPVPLWKTLCGLVLGLLTGGLLGRML